eukprot:m.151895 g.151895  ORF g.151895 m.151895 type:complete len:851 (-) comp13295_c3_seq1:60-2612(-)
MGQNQTTLAIREAYDNLLTVKGSVSIQDEDYWKKFYPEEKIAYCDFVELITGDKVRKLKEEDPSKLETLIRRAICTLSCHMSSGGLNGFPTQFQVVNIVRLLTRLIPFIFEDHDWDDFWMTPTPVGLTITLPEKALASVAMQGAPMNMRERLQAEQDQAVKDAQPPTNPPPPLYQTLMVALLDLMFAPGFCVHQKKKRSIPHGSEPAQGTRPPAIIDATHLVWYAGIETENVFEERPSLVAHQLECVRLLVTCLSRPLYQPLGAFDIRGDLFASYIVGGYHRHTLPLIRSLSNAFLSYDPVGMGLPYNYVLVPQKNREDLMELCGELFCFLLDFVPYPSPSDPEDATHGVNKFIDWMDSLKEERDFEFIADQMKMLLENPLQSYYIPSSYKSVNCHQQLLILFWRLCETNKAFLSYLMKSGKVLGVLMPLLFRLNEAKTAPGDFGLVQVCIYTLVLLSGQRNFSVHLNEEFDGSVVFENIPFSSGNYADLLFMVVHGVLVADNPQLSPFYELLLTVIVNVAPFIKRVSLESANKLVHLFRVFSSPRYLFAAEANHRLVFFLLEAFNSLIQYQFEGNQHFVYCIIRVRKLFHELQHLSLKDAFPHEEEQVEGDEKKQQEEGAEVDEHQKQPQQEEEQEEGEEVTIADGDIEEKSDGGSEKSNDSDDALAVNVSQQKSPTYPETSTALTRKSLSISEQQQQQEGGQQKGPMFVESSVIVDKSEHPVVPSTPAFIPSQEWFDTWFPDLPLRTILRLLKVLVPQVEDLCQRKGVTHEIEIVEFLKKGTLVGLLPVPHQIITRRYEGVGRSSAWFTSYIWSLIIVKHLPNPTFMDTKLSLFEVKETIIAAIDDDE